MDIKKDLISIENSIDNFLDQEGVFIASISDATNLRANRNSVVTTFGKNLNRLSKKPFQTDSKNTQIIGSKTQQSLTDHNLANNDSPAPLKPITSRLLSARRNFGVQLKLSFI